MVENDNIKYNNKILLFPLYCCRNDAILFHVGLIKNILFHFTPSYSE